MVCHQIAKLGGHRYCDHMYFCKGDTTVFVGHVTLQNYMIKALWLYALESLKVSHRHKKFGGHRHSVSGDMAMLVCHVIWQDHVIKESCDFIGRSLKGKLPSY